MFKFEYLKLGQLLNDFILIIYVFGVQFWSKLSSADAQHTDLPLIVFYNRFNRH